MKRMRRMLMMPASVHGRHYMTLTLIPALGTTAAQQCSRWRTRVNHCHSCMPLCLARVRHLRSSRSTLHHRRHIHHTHHHVLHCPVPWMVCQRSRRRPTHTIARPSAEGHMIGRGSYVDRRPRLCYSRTVTMFRSH